MSSCASLLDEAVVAGQPPDSTIYLPSPLLFRPQAALSAQHAESDALREAIGREEREAASLAGLIADIESSRR